MMSGTTKQGARVLVDFPLYLFGPGKKSYCGKGENGMYLTSRQFCKRQPESEMHKCLVPGCLGNKFCMVVHYVCGSSVQNLLHLFSGTQNFGIDPRLMENLCTHGVNIYFERKTAFLWHFFSFDYWCINCFDVFFVKWLMISEKGVKEDVEGNGHGRVSPTIPVFVWLDWRNSQTMSLRTVSGLRFETQTILLPPWPWYWSVAFGTNTHWLNDVFADVRTECRCTDVCSSGLPRISGVSCSSCCI